jgi:hypothetical protein
LLACMAGKNNTGQQIATHLFLHLLPIIIFNLAFRVVPRKQASLHTLVATIHTTAAWHLQEHACNVCQKRVKRYKKPVTVNQENNKTTNKMRAYLVPFLFASHKVDCCIQLHLRHFWCPYSKEPRLLFLQGATTQPGQLPPVQFDSNLFPIGIDNHASQCMANAPTFSRTFVLQETEENLMV